MAWFKVDDSLPGNAKMYEVPLDAIGLWVLAGAWSAQQLTDGYIPASVIPMLRGTEANVKHLLEAKLWVASKQGFQFHDWDQYQPSADEVKRRRSKRAEAGRKGGLKSGVARRDAARSKREASASSKREAKNERASTPTRPDIDTDSLTSFESLSAQARETDASDEPEQPRTQLGTRLPAGWFPARSDANRAVEAGHDRDWLDGVLARFRDYWAATPGTKGRKADWDATWRNWVRREAEQQARNNHDQADPVAAGLARAERGENPLLELLKGTGS